MYLLNKYTTWYNNIVVTAKSRILPENTYSERHHIVPKCLGGGDHKDNLVKLTAKEHFVCHLLLTKMVSDPVIKRKMQFALNSFRRSSRNQHRHKLTASQYAYIRDQVSQARSESLKGNKFALGRSVSESTRLKMSLSNTGKKKRPRTEQEKRVISQQHTGKILSEETKQKMRKPKSASHCENIRKAQLGKIISDETKRKISEARLGRIPIKKECPHCGKMLDPGNYAKHLKHIM